METILAKDIPIQPGRWIQFILDKDANYVSIAIYPFQTLRTTGRPIRVIQLGPHKAGAYKEYWDGRNYSGERVASGIYFVTIRTEYKQKTYKEIVSPIVGCLENLVRSGWNVVYAARECNVPYENVGLDDCIATQIRQKGKSFSDALHLCKYAPKAKEIVLPEQCLELKIRDGWDINVAAKECGMKLDAPELNECVTTLIWQGQTYRNALQNCSPELTDTEAGKGNDSQPNGKTKMPKWAWGAIAFGAMFFLMGRR